MTPPGLRRILGVSIPTIAALSFVVGPARAQEPVPLPGDDAVPMPGDDAVPMPGATQAAALPDLDASLKWRGYVESTLNGEYQRLADQLAVFDGTRVRVNLLGQPNEWFDFNVGAVGLVYAGATRFHLAGYLPDDVLARMFHGDPIAGVPPAAALLVFQLEDKLYLQEAFGTLYMPHLKIRVGRQKTYSGTGFAYNPIDLFVRKDPLDPTYEVDGIDAILAALELPAQTEVEVLARWGTSVERSDFQLRLKSHMAGFDLAAQYTHHVRLRTDWTAMTSATGVASLLAGAPSDAFERQFRWHFVGAELAGEILGVGLHAEGGYAFIEAIDSAGSLARAAMDHERVLVGIDYTFGFQLYVLVEYLRLGQGRTRRADISLDDRLALMSGEILALDRDTVFAGISYPLTDLSEIALYGLASLNDGSGMLNPWLLIDVAAGVNLSFAAFVPLGTPEGVNGRAGPGGMARLRFNF